MSRNLGWPERHRFGPTDLRHLADVLETLNHEQPMPSTLWEIDVVAPVQVWAEYDVTESTPDRTGYDGKPTPPGDPEHTTQPVTDHRNWTIQEIPSEGAPFLLCNGVLVGRLYGGAPIMEMMEKLNQALP